MIAAPLFPAMLAQNAGNWSDLIVFGAIIMISIIGAIAKKWEQKQEEQGKSTGTPGGGVSTKERLKKLAEQRRRQLQEMAEGPQRPARSPRADAERADRHSAEPVFDLEPEPESADRSATDAARAEALRRAAQRQRRQQEERERQRQQHQRELDRQRRFAERSEPAASRAASPRRPAPTRRTPAAKARTEHTGVHRHVPDAPESGAYALTPDTPASIIGKSLNQQKLREAILLKEILDKPVALRDPLDFPMNQ